MSIHWVQEDLRDAGFGRMPGVGAEIFYPEVLDQLYEHKADMHAWLDIHRTAHEIGLRTNCTMLHGHVENAFHRVDHLLRLRELQDQMGGFHVFIPLALHPENTKLSDLKKTSALMELRTMAIRRLILAKLQHIKAYWIMPGIEATRTALADGLMIIMGRFATK